MSDISIVTAFFNIGRGDWTPQKGLPHYLERSTKTYIERFSHLCKLENEIVVITSPDLVEELTKVCSDRMEKTKIVPFDLSTFVELRQKIISIQNSDKFKNAVHQNQRLNPEYWNPDYVLVTNLKAYFTNYAVKLGLVSNDMVAWIDFGYCRSETNIPKGKKWEYNFDPTKIHLFNYKDYDNKPLGNIVLENDVYILGAKVVAHKDLWDDMEGLMLDSQNLLMENGLVDDDQGLWLISYLMNTQLFQLHRIPDHQFGHDPFVLFNQFNDKA